MDKDNNNYEKMNFKDFVIIFVVWLGLFLLSLKYISISQDISNVKLVFLLACGMIYAISFVVYKKDRLYWLSGYTYREVSTMPSKKRIALSTKFYEVTFKVVSIISIYMILGFVTRTGWLLDTLVFTIGLIIYAILVYKKLSDVEKEFGR